MQLFDKMSEMGHEEIVFWHDPDANYRGIVAIHSTVLGPALGGTRFWSYGSEAEAVVDVLRLSRGMTYKAATAGLDLGGGKAVIMGDPRNTDREALFRAHGRFVETLGGRYITAEDVGTSVADMEWVHMETRHVTGLKEGLGDPSPVTAWGTFQGIRACALEKWGSPDLDGRRVAVQGTGHVGYYLCKFLAEEGAQLTVTDIEPARVQRVVDELGATAVDPDAIYSSDADVFAPCALGAVINDDTIGTLTCDIVAGAANNQLAEERHGRELHERGILYAPDYVINAGGLINVFGEIHHWTPDRAREKAGEIFHTLGQVFETAREKGIPTNEAADRVAERRLRQAARQGAGTDADPQAEKPVGSTR